MADVAPPDASPGSIRFADAEYASWPAANHQSNTPIPSTAAVAPTTRKMRADIDTD